MELYWIGSQLWWCLLAGENFLQFSDLAWFLVIHNPLWKHFWGNSQWFLVILDDSWWFVNHSENIFGWFSVILDNSQWFVNQSEIVLGDSQWFTNHTEFFGVILDDSQWFVIVLGWFLLILGDLQISLKLFWSDSQWFMNHSENIFGEILIDS